MLLLKPLKPNPFFRKTLDVGFLFFAIIIVVIFCSQTAVAQSGMLTVDGNSVGGVKVSSGLALLYPSYKGGYTSGDFTVSDKTSLLSALSKAKSGQVVFVKGNATIDLSTEKNVIIPDGVILASDRGRNKSKGALLFTDSYDKSPLFSPNSNATITGLRIKGPDQEIRDKPYGLPVSDGIQCNGVKNVKITNNEIYGWSHSAIFVRNSAVAFIDHNYIHHNRRIGLGYGVSLDKGSALIRGNIFDYNRHAVAGTGVAGTGYRASYNLVLPNSIPLEQVFDMHGGSDRKDGTNLAGDSVNIDNNTIYLRDTSASPAIVIRGAPALGGTIANNQIIRILPTAANAGSAVSDVSARASSSVNALSKALPVSDSRIKAVGQRNLILNESSSISRDGYIRQYYVPFNMSVSGNKISSKKQ
ncbi:right-handed parallel beta-helix repeat-containing protein [Chitinophaga sp. RAB17]|uniref:right-handed parallel beta-helix repeat-containing protein n=1 Tax=Chitinophaga sp. RAB17 TaxID=3233049 RepID=UPI003F906C36